MKKPFSTPGIDVDQLGGTSIALMRSHLLAKFARRWRAKRVRAGALILCLTFCGSLAGAAARDPRGRGRSWGAAGGRTRRAADSQKTPPGMVPYAHPADHSGKRFCGMAFGGAARASLPA